MNLTDINVIRPLLAENGFRFSKAKGQNFLRDASVPPRIADAAGLDAETGVLEVGPGVGCLTVELAARAKRVVSVEVDTALKPVLAVTLAGLENVEVLLADVLALDIPRLVREEFADCARVCVCANLPYSITSPALVKLLEADTFDSVCVMLQREVCRRICARENTADYSAFSVFVQWYAEPEMLFDVPRGCFVPEPKVDSAVIMLTRRAAPLCAVESEEKMFKVVRAAFAQRRKTLANALANGLGITREQAADAIAECGLPPTVRGEALGIEQFAQLSEKLRGAI